MATKRLGGQWSPLFAPTPIARGIQVQANDNGWSVAPAPFDGVVPVTFSEFTIYNMDGTNSLQVKFGYATYPVTIAASGSHSFVVDNRDITIVRDMPLLTLASSGTVVARVEYRFANGGR
jgi:hypothetical protein